MIGKFHQVRDLWQYPARLVNARVPHITLKSIANNTEIDLIWESFQEKLEPIKCRFKSVGENWADWEIPRDAADDWTAEATAFHRIFGGSNVNPEAKEIDASIAAKADFEYLYDKPYEDKNIVRVAGPFTVESLSPHRVMGVDENDELIDGRCRECCWLWG